MLLQWNVDAFEVRRQEYRLAMAVGTNRHYRIDEIVPRHFVQSASMSGVSMELAERWMWDVASKVPEELERVRHRVGSAVPEELVESIGAAASRRAGLLETVRGNGPQVMRPVWCVSRAVLDLRQPAMAHLLPLC